MSTTYGPWLYNEGTGGTPPGDGVANWGGGGLNLCWSDANGNDHNASGEFPAINSQLGTALVTVTVADLDGNPLISGAANATASWVPYEYFGGTFPSDLESSPGSQVLVTIVVTPAPPPMHAGNPFQQTPFLEAAS